MKNRNVVIILTIMIFTIVLCGIKIFYSAPISENIKNKSWYNYDIKTGAYSIIKIENDKFTYMSDSINLNNCLSYKYNKKAKTINLDCGVKISINNYDKDYINLKINENSITFFDTFEGTQNYEFEKYYEKSIIEYTNEKKEVQEILKVNINKIRELGSDSSIIIFKGNNCNNLDCTLLLGILEKWNVDSSNVYYIDSSNINVNELINIDNDFSNYRLVYNSNYPLIIKYENGKIKDASLFKCNGFDCRMWKDYVK